MELTTKSYKECTDTYLKQVSTLTLNSTHIYDKIFVNLITCEHLYMLLVYNVGFCIAFNLDLSGLWLRN